METAMSDSPVNRKCAIGLLVLSLAALALVLAFVVPMVVTGVVPPPAEDEGLAAHTFQLLILALVPTGLVYLGTADWRKPLAVLGWLAIPFAAVGLAFTLLFRFEM
jgi:hypothetical protein